MQTADSRGFDPGGLGRLVRPARTQPGAGIFLLARRVRSPYFRHPRCHIDDIDAIFADLLAAPAADCPETPEGPANNFELTYGYDHRLSPRNDVRDANRMHPDKVTKRGFLDKLIGVREPPQLPGGQGLHQVRSQRVVRRSREDADAGQEGFGEVKALKRRRRRPGALRSRPSF